MEVAIYPDDFCLLPHLFVSDLRREPEQARSYYGYRVACCLSWLFWELQVVLN